MRLNDTYQNHNRVRLWILFRKVLTNSIKYQGRRANFCDCWSQKCNSLFSNQISCRRAGSLASFLARNHYRSIHWRNSWFKGVFDKNIYCVLLQLRDRSGSWRLPPFANVIPSQHFYPLELMLCPQLSACIHLTYVKANLANARTDWKNIWLWYQSQIYL